MTNGSLVLFTQKEIRFAATLTAFLLFVETVLCEFDKFAFLEPTCSAYDSSFADAPLLK